jgi:hypothetical protein
VLAPPRLGTWFTTSVLPPLWLARYTRYVAESKSRQIIRFVTLMLCGQHNEESNTERKVEGTRVERTRAMSRTVGFCENVSILPLWGMGIGGSVSSAMQAVRRWQQCGSAFAGDHTHTSVRTHRSYRLNLLLRFALISERDPSIRCFYGHASTHTLEDRFNAVFTTSSLFGCWDYLFVRCGVV